MDDTELSEQDIAAGISSIEKQLTKALRKPGKDRHELAFSGKVQRSNREAWNSSLVATSPAGSSLHIVVREERTRNRLASHQRTTGKFSVLIQEVRDAKFKIKYRAKEFKGLLPQLTDKQLAAIVDDVRLRLTSRDQIKVGIETQKTADEQARKEYNNRLQAIERALSETPNIGPLTVTWLSDGYHVEIRGLSEADLKRFLVFWGKRAK